MRPTWIPLGILLNSEILPTGSGSAATCRNPSNMESIRAGVSSRRSSNGASNALARPCSISRALASARVSRASSRASRIANRARLRTAVDEAATIRDAARAAMPNSTM